MSKKPAAKKNTVIQAVEISAKAKAKLDHMARVEKKSISELATYYFAELVKAGGL